MRSSRTRIAVVAVAVLVTTCAVAVAASAVRVTASGVGSVKLGKTYTALRGAGLLGKIGPGCEFAGPRARSAPLRPPLRGSVDFTMKLPRRVNRIVVSRGAAARGVGIGSSSAAVRRAFTQVAYNRTLEATFGITIARVPASNGGPLEFALDAKTRRVTLIGIPSVSFCE